MYEACKGQKYVTIVLYRYNSFENLIKSQVNIIMLYVDIVNRTCEVQEYATIQHRKKCGKTPDFELSYDLYSGKRLCLRWAFILMDFSKSNYSSYLI